MKNHCISMIMKTCLKKTLDVVVAAAARCYYCYYSTLVDMLCICELAIYRAYKHSTLID